MYNHILTQNLGSGIDFEEHVAYLLRKNGFSAQLIGNDDCGIDIIAQAPTAGNPKFLIQCKYQNTTLNLTAVQEVFTGAALRGHIGHPVVFTTSHITGSARESADALGVEIIAFPELKKLELAESGQPFAGDLPVGLAGILYGLLVGNRVYADKCSYSYFKSSTPALPAQIDTHSDSNIVQKEIKRRNIEEVYRQISLHEQELQALQFKESQYRQQIQKLQKEAQLQLLDAL